ncbi:MAG: PAS domain S-box protein [Candidatus Hatepunaea meridiana]|nr:PAS domain S-box protein [Candidatus Hatepunaea meridiana]
MNDQIKTKAQLIDELAAMRQRITELEGSEIERKQMEELLKESEEKFRVISASALDAVILIDDDGNIVYWNPAAERIFGYTNEEMTDQNVHEILMPKQYSAQFKKGFKTFKKTGDGNAIGKVVELTAMRKDGNEFPIEIAVSPIRIKEKYWASAIIRDITERKKTEETLLIGEERYRALFEQAGDAIVLENENQEIIDFSDKACELFGYSRVELLSMKTSDLQAKHYGRLQIYNNLDQPIEMPIVRDALRKDGTKIVLELTIVPLKTSGQKLFMSIVCDITDRKRAEEKLKESEKKYSSLVESSQDCIILIQDGLLKYVNPAGAQLVGYTLEEMINKNFIDFIAPHSREFVLKKHQDRLAGRPVPNIYEFELLRKDGSTFPVEANASLTDYEAKPTVLAFIRDITERKRVEEALWEERSKSQTYLNIAGVMFVALNHNGVVTMINNKGCEILGYEKEEILGKNWLENFLPERLREEMKFVHADLTAGDIDSEAYYENPILTVEGEERLIAWHNIILVDDKGNISGTLSSGEDITERKRAEKTLLESECRFRDMAELFPECIYECDLEGNLTFVSQIGFERFGYTSEDYAKGIDSLQMVAPVDRRRAAENIARIIKGELLGGGEYTAIRKDGTKFPVIIYSSPIMRENDPIGFRGIVVDITERKRSEEALKKQMEEIEKTNRLFMGREYRIVEMKREVNELLEKLGQPKKYSSIDEQES